MATQDNATLRLWSCVGSAGVVNPPDLSKVLFNNSIVQLGPARSGVVAKIESAIATPDRIGFETVTATIRYGVVPVEGLYVQSPLERTLSLDYRDGSGYVVAKFIQVSLNVNEVVESAIFTFDSRFITPPSNVFRAEYTNFESVAVDFATYAYYVELTLGVTERVTGPLPEYPPAVSVIKLLAVQATSE